MWAGRRNRTSHLGGRSLLAYCFHLSCREKMIVLDHGSIKAEWEVLKKLSKIFWVTLALACNLPASWSRRPVPGKYHRACLSVCHSPLPCTEMMEKEKSEWCKYSNLVLQHQILLLVISNFSKNKFLVLHSSESDDTQKNYLSLPGCIWSGRGQRHGLWPCCLGESETSLNSLTVDLVLHAHMYTDASSLSWNQTVCRFKNASRRPAEELSGFKDFPAFLPPSLF